MNRTTGRSLAGLEHLRQSVGDILTTPIGSRVMRREYGSLLPELIDQPDNPATQIRVFAAVAGALMRWEPRLRLTRVSITRDAPGRAEVLIDAMRLDTPRQPQPLTLRVPVGLRQGSAA
ncbi:GPW/gp25 family protein [Acidovorax sp. SUPP1855]|uniref:GPW/gp25 family protein n=1 Tax=Acidovorax sp. SUPP1855 TaxID=431774 RepID=UPI0023DE59B7|nr:GPW/gp25 family protein [Acidovorax sp. SUPP1855]GKS83214.1 GPW/gp25 family protein [Acidovorax sp. SUPP1855]